MLRAEDNWESGSPRVTMQIGSGIVVVDKRLLKSSFIALICASIFVVDDDEIASQK
jgi:hypothetical protein